METEKIECENCEGTGEISYQREDGYEGYDTCPVCDGIGEVNAEGE